MEHKCVVLLAALLGIFLSFNVQSLDGAAYAAPTNKSHNLIVGYRMPGDRLVHRENIVKKSQWMKVLVVQKTFNASKYYRITQVKALDQKTNGNGAYASLISGGPGHQNVTMKFKSQRGHSINFVVELYARP